MPKTKTVTKPKSDPAALRTLIRIARSAHASGDELLLHSAALELDAYGVTLADLGIATPENVEVAR